MNAKLFRASLGVSQQDLAEACGLERETIARWESEDADFPARYLRLLGFLFARPECRPELTPELLADGMALLLTKMERFLAAQKTMSDL